MIIWYIEGNNLYIKEKEIITQTKTENLLNFIHLKQ